MPAYKWDAGASGYRDLQTGSLLVRDARPFSVAVIGDSLTAQSPGEAAMRSHLEGAGWAPWAIYWNAVSGRWLVAEDSTGQTTLTVIDQARSTLETEPLWVIGLGTNGRSQSDATTDSQLDQILNKLGAGAQVVWINLALMDPDDADVARRNARLNAMQARHPDKDITVADWKSFIHAQPNQSSLWNVNDGIHYSGTGSALRQEWVAQQAGAPGGQDPAHVDGWGLPTWRDEKATRLAYRNANPGLHDVDPAVWSVRPRSELGLTFDSAITTKENVTVEDDGLLVLSGTWLPDAPQPRTPTAGGPSILTHNTGYIDHRALGGGVNVPNPPWTRYGRWEMRAKVPTGANTRGTLAAFWLRNGSSGEIDIMESWGEGGTQAADYHNYVKGRSSFTTFQNTSTGAGKSFWRYEQELGIPQSDRVSDDYHTWVLEWTPEYLAIFRDGQQALHLTPSDTVTEGQQQVSASKYWTDPAYNSPWHLRINLHVGPSDSYWGVPDPDNREWTQDPLRYEIEHVRVWTLEDD